ncbi:MAG: ATP-binding protein, partial [Acutalibacteraceae bacterium]
DFNVNPDYIGYSDRELIDNIFGNYISNAISHCENEKLIIISCEPVEDNYRVSVFNTGKPIAREDIDNIWQSFYRADKAHSRAEGRFGLGLSIVASAQSILGRDYGVINNDNGVVFWFDIARYDKPDSNSKYPTD